MAQVARTYPDPTSSRRATQLSRHPGDPHRVRRRRTGELTGVLEKALACPPTSGFAAVVNRPTGLVLVAGWPWADRPGQVGPATTSYTAVVNRPTGLAFVAVWPWAEAPGQLGPSRS